MHGTSDYILGMMPVFASLSDFVFTSRDETDEDIRM